MIILSHRGYWKTIEERNTLSAFRRSFLSSYGTETDIRDYKGELVISHDIADSSCITVDEFLRLYISIDRSLPLALNIKSDGLQKKLKDILLDYKIENYFVFDMSVPDAIAYSKSDIKMFTRQSEYEIIPALYELSEGVWADEFETQWIHEGVIKEHILKEKKICIVSPELHGRKYEIQWDMYKRIQNSLKTENIMLCTDYPDNARRFFNE